MAQQQIFVATLVLFLCVRSGLSLQCYVCNSVTDANCNDKPGEELPKDLLQNCPRTAENGEEYRLCRKIKQIIEFEVNGLLPNTRVIRSCGWDDSNYKNRCYQRSGYGGRQEVCSCEGDKCNGSVPLQIPFALLAVMLVIQKIIL